MSNVAVQSGRVSCTDMVPAAMSTMAATTDNRKCPSTNTCGGNGTEEYNTVASCASGTSEMPSRRNRWPGGGYSLAIAVRTPTRC